LAGFLTTPLILLDLLLTAGLPWPTILYTILLDEVIVVTGLVGALVKSTYKWGYLVFGCAALFFVAWIVLFDARGHARSLGADIHRHYTICGAWIIGLWFLYPIAWGVSEGGNVISPDSEAIFYGVLDVLSKPVFGALLLWGHRNIDISRLGLNLRIPASDTPSGAPGSEKVTDPGAANGTSAPATTV
jgi:bacteriorhodopsin